jgi:large subunit ribosomal protein L23
MAKTFVIRKPHITEKATSLAPLRKYVFSIDPGATKNEVKKAVKELYNVDTAQVSIINLPGKNKRFRNIRKTTSRRKKAIVTLKEGQAIDLQ